MKNEILKLGIILCIITAIAAGILGFVNNITTPIIEEQQIIANNESRREILPSADDFEEITGDFPDGVDEIYKGLNNNETVGYTIKTVVSGYGGDIEVITGILSDGTISGVTIGDMSETPGLGAKASDEDFKGQYKNKLAEEINVSKSATGASNEIVAIAGATITSKAVTDGVNLSIDVFNQNFKN